MSDELREAIVEFFEEMDQVSVAFEGTTDTDVRDMLHVTLNYHFVWGKPVERWPVNFIMSTEEGNQAVAETVQRFLSRAVPLADEEEVSLGFDRWALLLKPGGKTTRGSDYSEFVGWTGEPSPPNPPMLLRPNDLEEVADSIEKLGGGMKMKSDGKGGFTWTMGYPTQPDA